MKRILVPTDLSSLSLNSLDFALDLARAGNAEVDLVYFTNTPIEAATFKEQLLDDTFRKNFFDSEKISGLEAKLKEIAQGKASSNVKINVNVGGSGVVSGSDKYVNAFGIDLIVLGADDNEEAKDEFPISVSQELTQFVKVPVISLTEHVDYADMTKVVLAVDLLEEKYQKKAMKIINSIADSFGAKIYLINVISSGEADANKVKAMLQDFAKGAELKDFEIQVIEHKNDLEGILQFADKVGAGMIATVSDGRPGIFRFFKDSFATTVVKATDLPVMVLNKQNL